jgi:hypothetical protein
MGSEMIINDELEGMQLISVETVALKKTEPSHDLGNWPFDPEPLQTKTQNSKS